MMFNQWIAVLTSSILPVSFVLAQESKPGFLLQTIADTFPIVVSEFNFTWPFVTNPVFDDLAGSLTATVWMCPIVTAENRMAWEAYSGGGVIYELDPSANYLASPRTDTSQYYCPMWQGSDDDTWMNFDLFSVPDISQVPTTTWITPDPFVEKPKLLRIPYTSFPPLDRGFITTENLSWLIYPIQTNSTTGPLNGIIAAILTNDIFDEPQVNDDEIAEPPLYDFYDYYFLSNLPSTLVSYTRAASLSFPFVRNGVFDVVAESFLTHNKRADLVAFCPLVSVDLREAWESFVSTQSAKVIGTNVQVPTFLYEWVGSGEAPVPVDGTSGPFCPIWQHSPRIDNATNFNLLSTSQTTAFGLLNYFATDANTVFRFVAQNDSPIWSAQQDIALYPVKSFNLLLGIVLEVENPLIQSSPLTSAPLGPITLVPTIAPTGIPMVAPTASPSNLPTTELPTLGLTSLPTTQKPVLELTTGPSAEALVSSPPTREITLVPTNVPTVSPFDVPVTPIPSVTFLGVPTQMPAALPDETPTTEPVITPTTVPERILTSDPTSKPTIIPTLRPSRSVFPILVPSSSPSTEPSVSSVPSHSPSMSVGPTVSPTQPNATNSIEPTLTNSSLRMDLPSEDTTTLKEESSVVRCNLYGTCIGILLLVLSIVNLVS